MIPIGLTLLCTTPGGTLALLQIGIPAVLGRTAGTSAIGLRLNTWSLLIFVSGKVRLAHSRPCHMPPRLIALSLLGGVMASSVPKADEEGLAKDLASEVGLAFDAFLAAGERGTAALPAGKGWQPSRGSDAQKYWVRQTLFSSPSQPTSEFSRPRLLFAFRIQHHHGEVRNPIGAAVPVWQGMTGRVAGKDRCQVKANAIDVHFLNPVAEAVHDQAADDRSRFEPNRAERGGIILPVEEQKFDRPGGPGEKTEVDATVNDGGAAGELCPVSLPKVMTASKDAKAPQQPRRLRPAPCPVSESRPEGNVRRSFKEIGDGRAAPAGRAPPAHHLRGLRAPRLHGAGATPLQPRA